jgi:hypothetical protein
MFKWYLHPFYSPPETGAGGTTENIAGSSTTEGSVTSGTASDAMIKAAMESESSSDTPTTGAEAGAVGPVKPAGTTEVPTTQAAKGPQATTGQAPESRIEAAVKNAREATRAEVEKEYAWAKGVDPETVQTAFSIVSELMQDSTKFAHVLAGELGMKLVPKDAATETKAPAKKWEFPEGELRSEDGRRAYSQDQMREIVGEISNQLRAEFGTQLRPILDDRTNATRTAQIEAVKAQGRQVATEALAEARKLPHFTKENEPEILANLQAIPAQTRAKIGAVASLYQAYNKFLAEKVFPTIGITAEQQVRDANRKKAAASAGSVHPVTAGGDAKPVEIKSIAQLAKHMEQLEAAGTT